jgi:pimeloyl-ACP methyl ester carboxylesterase
VAGRVKPEYQQAMKELQSSEGFKQRDPAIMQAFFRIAFKPTLHDPKSSDRLNLVFQTDYAQKSQRLRAMLSSMEHYHLEKDLRLLEIPVLLLYGVSDPMPEETRSRFATCFQKVQRVEIAEAGHFPFVENNAPFLAAVREFLKQRGSKP